MEVEEREHRTVARQIQDARLPRMRTLEEFDFSQATVPATRIRTCSPANEHSVVS